MDTMTAFLKRHSLVCGILLMFLLTWPIDLSNSGLLPFKFPFIVYIFLGWGFIFAALIMTGLTLGRQAVIALLGRYIQWRVSWKWYLAALLLSPILILLGVYLNAAFSGIAPDFSAAMIHKILGPSVNLPLVILPWLLYEAVANGEEIGWRGYVLPRLQAKYSALTATLILGLIWGFWHLPKYLPDFDAGRFAWFMVHTLAQAVILTWIYNGTGGSLLLATLYHASSNTASMFVPMANTQSGANMGAFIALVLLELAAALIIVIAAGPARLPRGVAPQVQT
ncbi:MAG: CPBP family intramembrane glutamic endopeptidase [Bacteroidota bacterium]